MAGPHHRPYLRNMTSTTASTGLSITRPTQIAATVVLAAFTGFSVWVAVSYGPLGFLSLARDEPWGMQMLLDLAIACSFGIGWMAHDARKRKLSIAPFVVMTICLGSIGLLAYVVRRSFGVTS